MCWIARTRSMAKIRVASSVMPILCRSAGAARLVSCVSGRKGPRAIFFFFQAEDGIRDTSVTGVQTCALPILPGGAAGRTLEPGDLISTGTPAGVGASTGTFLKPGDVLHGTIEGIGTLVSPVEAE